MSSDTKAEAARTLEISRTRVEILQREHSIAQAEHRLLELEHEKATARAQIEQITGIRDELNEKLRALTGGGA